MPHDLLPTWLDALEHPILDNVTFSYMPRDAAMVPTAMHYLSLVVMGLGGLSYYAYQHWSAADYRRVLVAFIAVTWLHFIVQLGVVGLMMMPLAILGVIDVVCILMPQEERVSANAHPIRKYQRAAAKLWRSG